MEATSSTEDSCGKDGRANLPWPLHLREDTHWPELESMYRLNDNVCDFRENYSVDLEDWINFEAELDRMFALVSELNTRSEMMGNAVRNTGLWNSLLYLLFALDYTSPVSQGILHETPPLTLIQELTAKETRARPGEDSCRSAQSVRRASGCTLKPLFSSTLSAVVMRKTLKPSTTLKRRSENVDTFASDWRWWKRSWKRIRNWSEQHWTFSTPWYFSTFLWGYVLVPHLLVHPTATSRNIRENLN